ncbi:MAG: hypothetical protein IJ390_01000 [Lachnospiraceae bacterium]|nr:hypothetical protein [Lachnospiraceae bacterium]
MVRWQKWLKYLPILLLLFVCAGCGSAIGIKWSREDAAPNLSQTETAKTAEREAESLPQAKQIAPDPETSEVEETWQGVFYYAYSTLGTFEEQQLYREILNSLLSCEAETELSTLREELLEPVFECVMADHPEIFYVDGYTSTTYKLGDELKKITFSGTLTMEQEEIDRRKEQLEAVAAQWLSEAEKMENAYEKVKYLYEYLILHTDYELGCEDSQNICSVLLNGTSVCQGYAKTLQFLCQKLNIPAMLVCGKVKEQGHAWNMIQMEDGCWYYIDPTWGDASYLQEDGTIYTEQSFPAVNYDYFCVTAEQLVKTHELSETIDLPECSAVKYNYYRMEDLYLEGADEAKLAEIFGRASEFGWETVTFQCANEVVYDTVYQMLIEDQKIFDYLSGKEGTVAYSDSRQNRTFNFWLQ